MIVSDRVLNIGFCPFINTEESIIKSLVLDKDSISDAFELIPYPLAHAINTIGINQARDVVNGAKSSKKRIFICQHNLVGDIAFRDDDIIFTPHSSGQNGFVSIPHMAVNQNADLAKRNRSRLFSFLGSSKTHATRQTLINLYPDHCFDSGQYWGLDNGMTQEFKNTYIEMMGDSYFSICPRGTGISTVRLFESIYMNSIPVIIADGYEKPLSNQLDWDEFSITLKECDVDKLHGILSDIDVSKINDMRSMLARVNAQYINNDIARLVKNKLNNIK